MIKIDASGPPLASLVILLAFLLRIVGVQYGLPHIYHQDEPIIVNHALSIGVGGWNTHFFVIPPFTIYSMYILSGVYYVLMSAAGVFTDTAHFAVNFLKDPSAIYLIGRIALGVGFGVGTVALLLGFGRRIFGTDVALLSGFFLAVSYIHTQHSRYIYADIPQAFIATLLLLLLILATKHPTRRLYGITGVIFGWGIATKYTMVYFFPAILIAHGLALGKSCLSREGGIKFLIAAISTLIIYGLLAPFTFLDWGNFIGQIFEQARAEVPVGVWHHLSYSLAGGMGWIVLFLGIGGWLYFWRHERKIALITGVFVIAYYAVNIPFSQPFARYMLPIVPVVYITAAACWIYVAGPFFNRYRLKRLIFSGLVIILLGPTLYNQYLLLQRDTRTDSLQWIEKHIPAGSVIVVDNLAQAPRLNRTREQILGKFENLSQSPRDAVRKERLNLMLESIGQRRTYNVYSLAEHTETDTKYLFTGPLIQSDWDELKRIKARYLILNYSEIVQAYHHLKESNRSELKLLATFSPYRDAERKILQDNWGLTAEPHLQKELFSRRSLGPYLEIYEIKSS